MSDKISIELTQDQLDNINAVLMIGIREMKDAKILTDSFPKEISLKHDWKVPEDPGVDFLIRKGLLADTGHYGASRLFLDMFSRMLDSHPDVCRAYLDKLFLAAKKRGFGFSSEFRKGVAIRALDKDLLPDSGKLYYIKTYATSGSNGDWVHRNLAAGNLPGSAWDIIARSKNVEVITYTINNCPENVLPMVLGGITKVSTTGRSYNSRRDPKGYLEYLYNERINHINSKSKERFKAESHSTWYWGQEKIDN